MLTGFVDRHSRVDRYAQMLNTCFCTLFFCTGMPLLLHVAALDLALTFVADRWLFYHGCKSTESGPRMHHAIMAVVSIPAD